MTIKDKQIGKLVFSDDGIYIVHRDHKNWIADPIVVKAFATNYRNAQGEQAFVAIKFKNRHGKWKAELVASSMLTGHNSEFIALLSNRGYLWPSNRKLWPDIIGALSVIRPRRQIRVVDVPGWCGDAFVLPKEAYTSSGPNRRDFLIRCNPTIKLGRFQRCGTLDQWRELAKLCRHSSRARCVMAAAFTAPNLRTLGLSSFVLNLSGESTTGKSFLVKLACSVPGLNTSEGPDTWDGSGPAYEQRALGHRDSIMPLDELGHLVDNPMAVAKLVTFRLASNRPKAKAGQYVHANNLIDSEFRVIALSTSEDPIWRHLANGPQRSITVRGEQVRAIDLRSCVSTLGDVFDGNKADRRIGKRVKERALTVDKYAALAEKYQGEAYRAYLARRAADSRADAKLRKYMAEYLAAAPLPKDYRALRRVGQYFAAMYASAALAIDYRILPWSKKATLSDIQKCMNDAMGDLIAGLEPGMAAGGQKDLDLTAFSDLVDRASFVSLNSADRKTKSFIRRLRRADGFTKCDKIGVSHAFLFAKTFKHWYPNGTDRKRLTKLLRSRRMFRSGRRRDTCTREIFIAELGGKVSCYSLALKR